MPDKSTLADRVNTVRKHVGTAVDTLGESGAFGVAGSAVGRHVNKDLGRKITEIQSVYDTFGPDATKTLLATRAARSALKQLPSNARVLLSRGASAVTRAAPLVRGVLSIAETVARRL